MLIHTEEKIKMKSRSCCFTGHRPNSLPFGYNESEESCVKLKAILTDTIEKQFRNGVAHFISGMAMGIDIFAAEAVLKLKEKYPQITLECAIPCETQAAKWSENWRERYYDIIARSDKETMLQTHYTTDCMMKRNRYMVDNSEAVIAVWNGSKSGSGNTVRYAMSSGKKVIIIDPNKLK